MIINNLEIPKKKFIVAVSGGLDSLCLTMLSNEAAKTAGIDMQAVFINHNLRENSAEEILPFIDILNANGIKNTVLTWKHDGIHGNLEKKAREARYRLLTNFCYEIGAKSILVAHHALDQWETFFMRLSKGSGLRGLCAMRTKTQYHGITIERPLLRYTKKDLEQTLIEKFRIMDYLHDPMNFDTKYERVRWRKAYRIIAKDYGLDIENVTKSIERLQRADDCLDKLAENYKKNVFDGKYINKQLFEMYHPEIKTRVIVKIIEDVTGKKGRIVSYSLLERVAENITMTDFAAINIANCIFRRDKSRNIKVSIENRQMKGVN